MLSRVRRVRREAPDAGITLAELIVTMTLMTIVGTIALGWMIGSTTASSRTTESGIDTARARNAVDAWAGMLGVMSPVDRATPNARHLDVTATTITFDAQLDSKPSGCANARCTTSAATAVTIGLVGGDLVQSITRVNGTVDTQVLVPSDTVPTPRGSCLFSLYLGDGTLLSSGAGVPKCASLTAAEKDSVARVDFAFTLTPVGDVPHAFGTSVALPGSAA